MIYGCSGCKFRSTALEEVKAHHAVAHKDRGGGSSRRGKRAKQQPAKPLEVILIDSDDDDDDDDESGSDTDDDSGDESDDSFGGGAGSSDADVTDKATKGAEHASNWLSSLLCDSCVLRTSVQVQCSGAM